MAVKNQIYYVPLDFLSLAVLDGKIIRIFSHLWYRICLKLSQKGQVKLLGKIGISLPPEHEFESQSLRQGRAQKPEKSASTTI